MSDTGHNFSILLLKGFVRSCKYILTYLKIKHLSDICKCFVAAAQIHYNLSTASADNSKTILQAHSMACLLKGSFPRALLH